MHVYTAHKPRADGVIPYSEAEHRVWQKLMAAQNDVLEGYASSVFIDALHKLNLPQDRIPQCEEVSQVLRARTGWSVTPVSAMIPVGEFFQLLAHRQFPAAAFIRAPVELTYLQEPDIFHELFGHAPLLTDPRFAKFSEAYGRAGLAANDADRELLARLYWFTIEFGLVRTKDGDRAYGAGICSSPGELIYAVESTVPIRKPFDVIDVLSTPYRIDVFQPLYFVLESFDQLFDLSTKALTQCIAEARRRGDHSSTNLNVSNEM